SARQSAADPHGMSPGPALDANIPISPTTTPVPLYERGTMHARVCSGPPTHSLVPPPVAVGRGARDSAGSRPGRVHLVTPSDITQPCSRRHGGPGRDGD